VVNALCRGSYPFRQASLTQPFVPSKDKGAHFLPVRAISSLVARLSGLVAFPAITFVRITITAWVNSRCPAATRPASLRGSWWHISPLKNHLQMAMLNKLIRDEFTLYNQ